MNNCIQIVQKIVVTVTFICIISVSGYAQTFEWAKQMSGLVTGLGVSTDANGNSYVTGNFSGTATFGTIQITSYGASDIFIAKYDSEGNCIWVKKAGGTGGETANAITTDANGNSSVTGYFSSTATFGTIQLTSNGSVDIFIAQYDNAGNCLWAKKAGGTSGDEGSGISIDAFGNKYMTGYYQVQLLLIQFSLTCLGTSDMFIAKYNNMGNCIWAKKQVERIWIMAMATESHLMQTETVL